MTHQPETARELASLAVNAGRALQDEKRHYEIACKENARLRLMVDEYGAGAGALTDKLKRVRDLHRATCPLVQGEMAPGFTCGMCEVLNAPAAPLRRMADETATQKPDDTQTLLFWDEANAVTATDGRITIPLTRAVNLAQSAPAGHLILQLPTAAALRTALVKALMDNHDTESDTDCCGAEPPQDGTWGDCWCTLPPDHDGEHRCQPCTTRHGAPGWTDEPAAGARQDGAEL